METEKRVMIGGPYDGKVITTIVQSRVSLLRTKRVIYRYRLKYFQNKPVRNRKGLVVMELDGVYKNPES